MIPSRRHKAAEKEALIQQALNGLANGTYNSAHYAATKLNIPRSTLYDRQRGLNSHAQAHESEQNLSLPEERELVKWVTQLTIVGYPASHGLVHEMAEVIRKRRVASINDSSIEHVSYKPLGKKWTYRFLLRHPELRTVIGDDIELARLKEASRETINHWFHTIASIIADNNIWPQDIYNMDESGFSIGMIEATRVIVNATLGTRFQANPGRQEWVSVIECISADGSSIAPLLIFKGETMSTGWCPDNVPAKWQVSCNSKGWTSNNHGADWLCVCFELQTREKADGRKRLLICDGHDSHISGEFIGHCMNNNILLVVLPPHTSHLLQPLDVSIFSPLKKALSARVDRLIRTGVACLRKVEWFECYIEAREVVFIARNIHGGWRGAGLFPIDKQKVL